MLNKERIEKKNAAKVAAQEEAHVEAQEAQDVTPEVEEPTVTKKDRTGLKCTECGRVIAEVPNSGNKNGPYCGDCYRKKLAA